MNTRDLLNKLAAAEEQFFRSTFVAPVCPGAGVRVRVAGIAWQLAVEPRDFTGWAVLQPLDASRARVVEKAGLGQVREYLGHFAHASLVLCEQRDGVWLGLPAETAPGGVKVEGLAPVLLARDAQLFDPVRVRWDGLRFLFEGKNLRRDPSVAAFLREALVQEVQPDALERPGLLPAEREAYRHQWALRQAAARKAAERRAEGAEERLRRAVAHADGRLHSFIEREDHYAVTFTVDGVRHTSTVHKGDLSVMVAGICLSGEDDKFDLPSLVGVLREGQGTGAPRLGDEGMPVDVYREIHPRRRRRR